MARRTVEIVYKDFGFREAINDYMEDYPISYNKDLAFMEIKNLFEREEIVTIEFWLPIIGNILLISSNNYRIAIDKINDSRFCQFYADMLNALKKVMI